MIFFAPITIHLRVPLSYALSMELIAKDIKYYSLYERCFFSNVRGFGQVKRFGADLATEDNVS